jgi:hypothetical protein
MCESDSCQAHIGYETSRQVLKAENMSMLSLRVCGHSWKALRPGRTFIQWSDFQRRPGPDSDAETLQIFAEMVGALTKTREDIKGWFDLLDLDDYVSFGGKA